VLRQWRLVEKKIKELPEPLAQSLQLTAQQCPPLAQARGGEGGEIGGGRCTVCPGPVCM
jgi:hypothetical protein